MMSKKRRLDLIREIEDKRNSYFFAYLLSDRLNASATFFPDIVREIYCLLRELKPFEKKRGLDLFIYGEKGDHAVPWRIVTTIRELFNKFNVIIPYKAYGAATMIALGADEIIMGEKGELSSIDISTAAQIPADTEPDERMPFDPGDVTALIQLLERLGNIRQKQRVDALIHTLHQVSPLFLGRANRTLEQTKAVCLRLLQTRKKKFTKRTNADIIQRLFSEYLPPAHAISISEATKRLGLKQVRRAQHLEPTYWELLTDYEEELRMREPFCPEDVLDQSDEEEMTFRDHKLVYLETIKRSRFFQCDVRMRKLRQIPSNLQFNPQVVLPALQLPAQIEVNEQSVFDYVQTWLQSNLPHIIHDCFDEFRKEFPVHTYERLHLNKRWVDQ
ncbi:MAG: hypothetical protein R6V46_12775 [Desulfatiglandaceae bacterium]